MLGLTWSWSYPDPDPYPDRNSQGDFASSVIKTLASQPCNNWSLCWSFFTASLCFFASDYSEWTLEYLSPCATRGLCNKLHFVRSVSDDTGCYKRGQTSRPVVGTEIQTRCNSDAHQYYHCYLLGCIHYSSADVSLESSHQLLGYDHKLCTLCNNLDFLVHNYFHLSSSSPKSGEHPSSAIEPDKSTEHGAIQKGIGRFTMAPVRVSCLLSSRRSSVCNGE